MMAAVEIDDVAVVRGVFVFRSHLHALFDKAIYP
jgi:hypothetical protein